MRRTFSNAMQLRDPPSGLFPLVNIRPGERRKSACRASSFEVFDRPVSEKTSDPALRLIYFGEIVLIGLATIKTHRRKIAYLKPYWETKNTSIVIKSECWAVFHLKSVLVSF